MDGGRPVRIPVSYIFFDESTVGIGFHGYADKMTPDSVKNQTTWTTQGI